MSVVECGTWKGKINNNLKYYTMNVEVEIYMSNITKFFRENPKDLFNLIPEDKKEIFFEKVKEVATSNIEKGDEVSLTRQQLIDICVEINGKTKEVAKKSNIIIPTIFGEYCLN
jgi:hypothetical protein